MLDETHCVRNAVFDLLVLGTRKTRAVAMLRSRCAWLFVYQCTATCRSMRRSETCLCALAMTLICIPFGGSFGASKNFTSKLKYTFDTFLSSPSVLEAARKIPHWVKATTDMAQLITQQLELFTLSTAIEVQERVRRPLALYLMALREISHKFHRVSHRFITGLFLASLRPNQVLFSYALCHAYVCSDGCLCRSFLIVFIAVNSPFCRAYLA